MIFLNDYMESLIKIKDTEWIKLSKRALRRTSKIFFDKYLKGKKVINKDNSVEIILAKSGWRHTIRTNKTSYNNIVIFKKLKKVIELAKFDNFGESQKSDPKTTLGFLNYQSEVLINQEKYSVKITVRSDENGKFYYDHYIIE